MIHRFQYCEFAGSGRPATVEKSDPFGSDKSTTGNPYCSKNVESPLDDSISAAKPNIAALSRDNQGLVTHFIDLNDTHVTQPVG